MKRVIAIFLLTILLLSVCQKMDSATSLPASQTDAQSILQEEPSHESKTEGQSAFIRNLAKEKVDDLIDPTMDDFTKVKILYTYLVQNVYFAEPVGLDMWYYLSDEVTPPSYLDNRSISPLLYSVGSCEDYAAAMTLLLEEAGFSAEYVAGYTYSKEGDYQDHAWTVVEIQGEWYHLDPQLEKNSVKNDEMRYRYFLKTDNQMILDHRWGQNLIDCWPTITEDDRQNILENWTPPLCVTERDAEPIEKITLSAPPNASDLLEKIESDKKKSGKPPIDESSLHIEPPVLLQNAPNNRLNLAYGRSFFSEDETAFYDEICEATENFSVEKPLSIPSDLSEEKILDICESIKWDQPLFYWADYSVTKNSAGNRTLSILLKDDFSLESLKIEKEEILILSDELLQDRTGDPSLQLYQIHDLLAEHIEYDRKEESTRSGDLYGALVQKTAICEGYARVLQYMTQRAGIQNVFLVGKSHRGIAHAWNSVYLNGSWYYTDLTWDDADDTGSIHHEYLEITLDEMKQQHLWDTAQYPFLPAADKTSENYFVKQNFVANANQSTGEGFYKSALTFSPSDIGKEIYIEVRIDETTLNYQKIKEEFIAFPFSIINEINQQSKENNTSLFLQNTGDIKINYNDVTKTLVMRPILLKY